jgi:hypothetical protein
MSNKWLGWSTLLLTLVVASAAGADEARLTPSAGTSLTYRMNTVMKTGNTVSTFGEILTYTVTASVGPVAEGTIKPVAMIYGCAANDTQVGCATVRKMAGAKQEPRVLVIPIPDDLAARLTAQSTFKHRLFLTEKDQMAIPVPRPADNGEFVLDAGPVISNATLCPEADIQRFVPFSASAGITLHCELSMHQDRARDAGAKEETMPVEISYLGSDSIKVPAGEFEVQNLAYQGMPSADQPAMIWVDVAFSERLGVVIKSRSIYTTQDKNGLITSDTTTVLIGVSP